MPKIFKISTLIPALAIATTSLVAPVQAETIIDGTTYWEISEISGLTEEFINTKSTICGDNWECKEHIRSAYLSVYGEKFRAAESFSWRDFMFTAVNPHNSTVRIVYYKNHQDEMWHEPLARLRLFWYKDHEPSLGSISPAQLDEDPYAKILYDVKDGTAEFEELLSGNEIEIKVPAEFFTIGTQTIHFVPEQTIGSGYGSRNFANCVDLEESQECRVVMEYNANTKYIPLDIIKKEEPTPVVNEPEETPAETSTSEIKEVVKYVYRASATGNETALEVASETPENQETTEIIEPSAETPENVDFPLAGNSVDHYNAGGEYAEFPWWIFAIIAASVVGIAWFFAGKREK